MSRNLGDPEMPPGCLVVLVAFVLLLVFAAVFGFYWWRASIQADVYGRQGVQMSTWEVLMGAKPVERVFVNPEAKP